MPHIEPEDLFVLKDVCERWHGGQWTGCYSVLSTLVDGRTPDPEAIDRALSELRKDTGYHTDDPDSDLDEDDIDALRRIEREVGEEISEGLTPL